MADAVVSTVVQWIGDQLLIEAKFLHGVKGQVVELHDEFTRMQCFLKDAEARQVGDEMIRNWVTEIRQLAYRTKDVLQIYEVQIASKRGLGILRRVAGIVNECIALHKVGSEIGCIKTRISNITTSLITYGVNATSAQERSNSAHEKQKWLRMSNPRSIEEDFVGMEEDIMQLVSRLVKGGKPCGVVSIWGMGGLGKTTLAKKVYHHTDVQHYFNGFAWVCITQQCQTKIVFQDILIKLRPEEKREDIKNMGDVELVELLHKVLQEKKCLVVLDDIWKMVDWNSLKLAFPTSNSSSKILLTTREKEVAEAGYVHELNCLTEDEGWKLLQKKAFPESTDDPNFRPDLEMEKLGRAMVRQCGGLPLAIAVVGGLLKDRSTRDEWDLMNKNIKSCLMKGTELPEAVPQVLALSFNVLPYQLKQCFLYLGNFPEDTEIEAEKLYLLWNAEGMISSKAEVGETMMDVAERYLEELARRSIVQVQLDDNVISSRRFRSCRLHDLMRDLCLSKGKEVDFLKVLDYTISHENEIAVDSSSSTSNTKTRILAIYCENGEYSPPPSTHIATQSVKSILFFGSYATSWPRGIPRINQFKALTVLDLNGIDLSETELSKEIDKLFYLRHLTFKYCFIKEIPSCISKLRCLQTLDMRVDDECAVNIPNVLWKMERLRHLYLPENFCVIKDEKLRLDGLSELETLVNFNSSSCIVEDLVKSTNLRNLHAYIKENLEDLVSILKHIKDTFNHLQHSLLYISDCNFSLASEEESPTLLKTLLWNQRIHGLNISGRIGKLSISDYHHLSSSLTILWMRGTELEEDPMPMLEQLPSLRDLALYRNSFVGEKIACSATGFPKLTRLHFSWLTNFKIWAVDEGSMPNLSTLTIFGCKKLEMVPDGLRFLKALRVLEIIEMPVAFGERVQVREGKKGDDFCKVRHVPLIRVREN